MPMIRFRFFKSLSKVQLIGAGFLLLIPLFYFIPGIDRFLYLNSSAYSDITISHLPNSLYIQKSILETGQIPLWSDAILGGYPFVADPLSGLWYPFAWLTVLFPTALGFNALFVIHHWVLGLGMYKFLRQEVGSEAGSMIGAAALMLMPKIILHYAAGHISLVEAIAWTPWLLWAARRSEQIKDRTKYLIEVPFLVLIILADVRWVAYSIMIWFAYHIWIFLGANITSHKVRIAILLFLRLAGIMLLAVLICSPFLLPFLEYVSYSTRATLNSADRAILSLPLSQILGLFIPITGGTPEYIGYLGVIGNFAVILTLSVQSIRRRGYFWLILLIIFLLLSFGSSLPFFDLLSNFPGMSLLRVPSRFLFLVNFCAAVLVGYAIDELANRMIAFFWNPFIYYLALTVFASLLSYGISRVNTQMTFPFWLVPSAYGIASLIFLAREKGWINPKVWVYLVLILCIGDFLRMSYASLSFRPYIDVMKEEESIAKEIRINAADERVYSPSYSIPQQTAVLYSLQLADGINPMQLQNYVNFMKRATGIYWNEYSVTLPPFPTGAVESDNKPYKPNAYLLGQLSVEYLVSAFPLETTGFELINQIDNVYLYLNTLVLPRAWVQAEWQWPPVGVQSADVFKLSPNRISLSASGPGVLVLSETYYPGWKAMVDGKLVQVKEIGGLFRAIDLPIGVHSIRFEFRPKTLYIGIAVSALILFGIFFFLRFGPKYGSESSIPRKI